MALCWNCSAAVQSKQYRVVDPYDPDNNGGDGGSSSGGNNGGHVVSSSNGDNEGNESGPFPPEVPYYITSYGFALRYVLVVTCRIS